MDNGSKTELIEEPVAAMRHPVPQRVDLVSEIVRYWWTRRWFITKTLTAALVTFIVLLLLVPKLYRAEATIMIVPPRFMPEQRPEPLSVGTARSLLSSGELLHQMILRIRHSKAVVDAIRAASAGSSEQLTQLSGMDPEQAIARYGKTIRQVVGISDEQTSALAVYLTGLSPVELQALAEMKREDVDEMTVQDLSEALESEDIVEKKTAVDVRFSPLLRLFAVADSGPKAQLLANTWARLFERMYEELTISKTMDQFASIKKQQEEMQGELERIQQRVVEFKAQNNLELYQKQIDEYTADFGEFSRQLTLKRSAYLAEQGRLQELQRLAHSMEKDQTWIGRVDVALKRAESLSADPDSTVALNPALRETNSTVGLTLDLKPEQLAAMAEQDESLLDGNVPEEVYEKIRAQAIQSRDRLAAAILELNEFYRQEPLQLMEKERDQLQKDYLDALSRLRAGQVRLKVLTRTVQELDERLSSTQRLLTLNTGVPNEAIANQVAQGESMARLTRLEFAREEINPEWQSLAQGKADLVQEMEMLKSEVDSLQKDLPLKEQMLRDLQNEIYRVQLSEQFMKENLDRWQRTNQELFDLYVETNNSIASTARQVKLLGVEVQNLEESTSRTKALVEEYQQRYNAAAAELALLESRQRAVQRQSDMLLQKLQDAQIAVSGEVSDISVAASAVTPSKHFFPRRSVFTIVFVLFAASLLLGALARTRYMELRQQGLV